MNSPIKKVMQMFAKIAYKEALSAANSVSQKGMFQLKEPESLKRRKRK
ncbi:MULTISPECIES: hypothetical protein [Bacillota]|jgi:cyclic lactone autoinducer peptide|uniref:Cyclic lactone autoinducer peptide n=2 Tax=Amedibacillus TaxID=2749846 RepID=A0A7G9GSB2_9FIRM|nr:MULTISPECIES: hypothetical protein [Bacillota]MCH4283669.1 hypothetical protein [Amedibacillus hominis]QNM13694.1 hypothetical protein H9Q80_07065 [[Eubacterium] hominis]